MRNILDTMKKTSIEDLYTINCVFCCTSNGKHSFELLQAMWHKVYHYLDSLTNYFHSTIIIICLSQAVI